MLIVYAMFQFHLLAFPRVIISRSGQKWCPMLRNGVARKLQTDVPYSDC